MTAIKHIWESVFDNSDGILSARFDSILENIFAIFATCSD